MDPISSAQTTSATVVRNADQNVAVAAGLLKKIDAADKNLVNTLLPLPAPTTGRLDIRA